MNAYRLTLDKLRLKGLDRQAVQGGSAVEQNGMSPRHFFQDVPDLGRLSLNEFLGRTHSMNVPEFFRRRMMKGSNRTSAIFLGNPHWWSLSSGPMTMTERPE